MNFGSWLGVSLYVVAGLIGLFGPPVGLVLPPVSYVSLTGQKYAIKVASGDGPYAPQGNQIVSVAATTLCAIPERNGLIMIGSKLTQRQQAKAIVHEVTHVGIDCDKRTIALDERVAEAMADLLESNVGQFVVEGLKK